MVAASGGAFATEGGGTSKPPGVDTARVGIMPPPGLFFTGTASRYTADRFLDGSGRERAGISNVDLDVHAVSMRLQYVWPGIKVWGADVETRGGVAAAKSKLAFDIQTPGGRIRRQSASSGLGDAFFAPVLLGWHGERFHQVAGALAFLPIGKFDAANAASIGRGYAAFSPAYFFTWLPDEALEVSGSLFYLVNRENRDTAYRSGQEASIDYGLGYTPRPGMQFGLNGYAYRQVTDDEQAGRRVGDGNRGQALAIGPFLRFYGQGWGVTLKWQHETKVENRADGNRLYLQVAIKL